MCKYICVSVESSLLAKDVVNLRKFLHISGIERGNIFHIHSFIAYEEMKKTDCMCLELGRHFIKQL